MPDDSNSSRFPTGYRIPRTVGWPWQTDGSDVIRDSLDMSRRYRRRRCRHHTAVDSAASRRGPLPSALRDAGARGPVSYTHLRAHETVLDLVCRLLLEK